MGYGTLYGEFEIVSLQQHEKIIVCRQGVLVQVFWVGVPAVVVVFFSLNQCC